MAGPRYTIAQTRARVAALHIAADHLQSLTPDDEVSAKQQADIVRKLYHEACRLMQKAQEVRRRG